jgi:hypothetical protein
MKTLKYLIIGFVYLGFVTACSDDENDMSPGHPVLEVKTPFAKAHFGDDLPFTVSVSDNVPLSTLTARLYFGDEEVSKTTLRTKENGDYSGVIPIPFYKDIPDGTATLEFTLMDTHLTDVKKSFDLPVSRAGYPYLILVTADASYPMLPTGVPYEYAATQTFPSSDLPASIKTPVVDDNGNEIFFGWEAGAISHGVAAAIPFVSPAGNVFSVTFNIKTYAAGPFFELFINEQRMSMMDKENFQADMELTQNRELTVHGLDDIADWWIDPDFFTKVSDNRFTFVPIDGKYRIIANTTQKWFKVEAMSGNATATLQTDGDGVIWVIGERVGKPSVETNEVGWNTDKALCMSPIGGKKYQLTVVGGETVRTDAINFKFFHQKGWGGEFDSATLTTNSDLILIGNGSNGADNGNLALIADKTLETGVAYVFVVDVSAGIDNAILTVTKK